MSLLFPIFFVSLIGSIHCSLMCCPLQSMTKSPLLFQLGRWGGYTLVWLLLKSVSWTLITKFGTPVFSLVSLLLIFWIVSEALLLMGYRVFHFKLKRKLKLPAFGPLSAWGGLSLSLRGCGWMWSFVGFAALEPSWALSYARLLAFFFGTLTPFLLGPYLPKSWALSSASRGRWLLALALFQIVMLFSNPLRGLHDLQALLLGNDAKNLPNPTLCGKAF